MVRISSLQSIEVMPQDADGVQESMSPEPSDGRFMTTSNGLLGAV